ncbi:MAG: lysine biosynthesis protein LysX, partial [Halolamina sp.]
MQVGLLYSRIRADEKFLLSELRERDHDVTKVDAREVSFDLGTAPAELAECDVVLDRCLATSRSRYATRFLEHHGIPVVNSAETAAVCSDKVDT